MDDFFEDRDNIKRYELATFLEVHESCLSQWAKKKYVPFRHIIKIADEFDCGLDTALSIIFNVISQEKNLYDGKSWKSAHIKKKMLKILSKKRKILKEKN